MRACWPPLDSTAVPPASAKRTLLFLHVPKAGGTALSGVLGNRFAAEECLSLYYTDDPADEELQGASYVFGHLSMSILDRFERPPFSITVLRDPIERALSTYSYFRGLDEPFQPRAGLERNEAARRLTKQQQLCLSPGGTKRHENQRCKGCQFFHLT